LWEQWVEHASAPQRQHALARAAEHGLLHAHELPASEGAAGAAGRRPLLTALLHGPAPVLEPVHCPCVDPIDQELDEVQRQAVSRALHSPDLSLVLGYAGTGKSRVVAEVLRQCARAGQRVLLVAPCAAAVDRVLERLAEEPALGIVRGVASDESEAGLPASLLPLTLKQRLCHFDEQTLPAARAAVEAITAAAEARRLDEPLWAELDVHLRQLACAQESLRAVAEQRAGLAAEIAADLEQGGDDTPFRSRWKVIRWQHEELLGKVVARRAEVRAAIDQIASAQQERDAERQRLVPLAEAKQEHRWWTGAFWRATLHGGQLARLEELKAQSLQAEECLKEARQSESELGAEQARLEAVLAEQRDRLVEEERARRDADLAEQQAACGRQFETSSHAWEATCGRLSEPTARPSSACREALEQARAAWAARRERDKEELSLRRQWLAALEQARPGLPRQLLAGARIVAGTTGALTSDPALADRDAGARPAFDLLVVEEALRLSDAELLNVSRRARRWLLVGDVGADLPVPQSPRRPGQARPRPVQARPAFQRLWAQLHPDARRLPARWRTLADGRLSCSLRPIAPEQEAWTQEEPVFDRPEIELRIVSPPRQEPQIAEVVFPATTPIEQAKEFIYRELQELSVQAPGPALHWHECERCVRLELGAGSEGEHALVPLEPGLHERVACSGRPGCEGETPWQTAALVFERGQGWDRAGAERWVADRLGLRDCGRTTVLARSYRAREPLARFLADVLYAGLGCAAGGAHKPLADLPAVELVSVPSGPRPEARREPEPRWGGGTATMAPPARAVRGGAGLEIDLADPRRRETLPADLRAELPAHGIVNLAEARVIVQALEAMAADPAIADASSDWQRHGAASGPAVAVISLFAAQVELLRRLVERSAVLAGAPLRIEVGAPAAFKQREALVALISLTRSHTTRAVPFSDTPQALLLALTRPAARLVLFGDPGTMLRRSQWHGGLDHLDDVNGPQEQALVSHLLGRLQGNVAPQAPDMPARLVRSRESSSV
jgi:hypothetical protein